MEMIAAAIAFAIIALAFGGFSFSFKRHRHTWKPMACFYAPPPIGSGVSARGMTSLDVLKAMHGVSTMIWECSTPTCHATKKEEALGKREWPTSG